MYIVVFVIKTLTIIAAGASAFLPSDLAVKLLACAFVWHSFANEFKV